jgi:nucleoside phosphorylase
MLAPSPPHDRRGFEIALICALPLEADCVHAVFDKFWEDEGKKYGKAPRDPNAYTTGVIGEHNVILAHMPNMGKASASGVAASILSSFPGIKLALVVGICGGVPYGTDNRDEILLGDIIISQALIQYDFGKQYPEAFKESNTLEDSLSRPSQEIRAILAKLKTYHYRQKMQDSIIAYLNDLQQKLPKVKYPGSERDKLYEALYLHKHRESGTRDACDTCKDGEKQICPAALRMTCDELGCKETRLVARNRLRDAQGPPGSEFPEEYKPLVHFGKIGSGDTVMKSGEDRDRIAKADGIIAFEMEGAGVWDHFPSIVIKGVCDYADSHKNKEWQNYAAATAAACMKAFLKEWTLEDKSPGQG